METFIQVGCYKELRD